MAQLTPQEVRALKAMAQRSSFWNRLQHAFFHANDRQLAILRGAFADDIKRFQKVADQTTNVDNIIVGHGSDEKITHPDRPEQDVDTIPAD